MRRFVVPGMFSVAAVALLALLAFGVAAQNGTPSIDGAIARGRPPLAPGATIRLPFLMSTGRESLADLRGRVVVVNVFASWCEGCKTEAGILHRAQQAMAGHEATLVGSTTSTTRSTPAGLSESTA